MKRFVLFLFLFISGFNLSANVYKIRHVDYNINGSDWKIMSKTKEYAIIQKLPVNKDKLFSSEEDVKAYIADYKLKLESLRAFDTINITYEIEPYELQDGMIELNGKYVKIVENEDGKCIINLVNIKIDLKDSFHLLVVPYPKYNSNTGTEIKLKAKDTNFLGTLNEMSSDLNFSLEQQSESDKPDVKLGLNFVYDYPFEAGIFDGTWINDYSIDYTFGDKIPEWKAKTGLEFTLQKRLAYKFGFYQYSVNDLDYKSYSDATYFTEEFLFSVPVTIVEIQDFGPLVYTPFINFSYNWDKNGINELNTDLSGPTITLGHTLVGKRINWHDQFRTGFYADLQNTFKYNFQRNLWYPFISSEIKAYKHLPFGERNYFNAMGLCADFYTFFYLNNYQNEFFKNDGKAIGSRLRGIRDNQYYKDSNFGKACTVPAAIILNVDFPFNIFTTSKLKIFDFSLQFSPFIDVALTYNKVTERWFSLQDGFYSAGLECLVYPLKWKGITVRLSFGYDVGRKFFDSLNEEWRDTKVSKYEITFGVGLHY
ncbi:MAG: hypothetical protein K6E97_11845 [Treponema sp.]|nr:hypothetical protein [Treponema sp.]